MELIVASHLKIWFGCQVSVNGSKLADSAFFERSGHFSPVSISDCKSL